MNPQEALIRHTSDKHISPGQPICVVPRVVNNCYLHWHN